ncbi:MAG: hypothetical protein DMD52_11855 [Gemmatimonadetes bacterium]|nr:MAG: hypothetical protein DMD52_11855 [Gemmatimonadota bacterium]
MKTIPVSTVGLCLGALAWACSQTATEIVIPTRVQLGPSDTTIPQRHSVQLVASVLDTAGKPIPSLQPSFTSSDPGVVGVSPTGLVTSEGPLGAATITAQFATFTAFARVTVRDSNIVERLPLAGRPFDAEISPGGVVYVTRLDVGLVSRLNLAQRAFTASVVVGSVPSRVTFNASGSTAYVSNQFSQDVGVINVSTNTQAEVIPTTGDPGPVALSIDGAALFVTTNADRLYRFSLANRAPTDSLALPATSHHLVVHPAGNLLYVATREGGSVLEVDARTLAVTRTFPLGGRTNGMVLSPDHRTLYVANDYLSLIHVITLSTGSVGSIALGGGPFALGLGPDGTRIYATLTSNGMVQVVDRANRQVVETIQTGGAPRVPVAAATQGLVVVPNEAGWVDLLR